VFARTRDWHARGWVSAVRRATRVTPGRPRLPLTSVERPVIRSVTAHHGVRFRATSGSPHHGTMTHKSPTLCLLALLACVLRAGVVEGTVGSGPEVVYPAHLDRADLRLAFGSCSRHDQVQTVWGAVRGLAPDAFVWLGDVIYADKKVNRTRVYVGNEAHASAFATQLTHDGYQKLIQETKILGTWDDHDFGFNNAGAEWVEKPFAKQVFLDFLSVPKDSPRRHRQGVYAHHTFRGLGKQGDRSARLILLDARFHQRLEKGELLGADQWRWLEKALGVGAGDFDTGNEPLNEQTEPLNEPFIASEQDTQPVDVTIIGSSIQVHAETQKVVDGLLSGVESWNEFPDEKKRLMDLVASSKQRVVFLSGDVHHAEIITSPERCVLPYELVEITSSGMTHGILDEVPRKYGLRTIFGMLIPTFLPPWLWPDVGGLQRTRFIGRNFGEVAVDFSDDDDDDLAVEKGASPSPASNIESAASRKKTSLAGAITLNIRGDDGKVKITKRIPLSDLERTWGDVDAARLRGELAHGAAEGRSRTPECLTEKDLSWAQRQRLPALAAVCLAAKPAFFAYCLIRLCVGLKRFGALWKSGKHGAKRKEA